MPLSSTDLRAALEGARTPGTVPVPLGAGTVEVPTPFPSPEDWRDLWIYFLMLDRFDNPAGPPRQLPWDGEYDRFQGGTLAGVQARLDYLQQLGAGALWLSPVLKNCQYDDTYHGYGIQDFLAVEPRLTSDPARARRDPAFADAELRALVDAAHARGIYVILDIVLNHAGDVFEYEGFGSQAPWRDDPAYPVRWRDETGQGRADWHEPPADPSPDAAIWPAELRRNEFLRRRGNAFTRPENQREQGGDFFTLKEFVTAPAAGGSPTVRSTLISAYQYAIAKFGVDAFRIDTLKFIEPDFALVFGNAIREYALSIGKRNFFTFGEVYDDEDKISRFIGRRATDPGDLVGVDAALDFPLTYLLPGVTKGMLAPSALVGLYQYRKQVEAGVLSSHGEASRFFVTFLDNHDRPPRFGYTGNDQARFANQVTLGLTCLFTLQGIPCVYYGTEQGLRGTGPSLESIREALWGKPGAFDLGHPVAQACRSLTDVRNSQPALRYGRQYFRPISGDGVHFGVSGYPAGVLAFSRILSDREVVVVANTNTEQPWTGEVIVDQTLVPSGAAVDVLFGNVAGAAPPAPTIVDKPAGTVEIQEVGGGTTTGPARAVRVTLRPMEVLLLSAH